MNNKTVYFPGLNGIRAIASLSVVIWHLDQFSGVFGLKAIGFYKNGVSGQAVNIFFVLSGFLITYLLLKEKEETGQISFRKFYIRRILRIWPIYYLSIIIALILTWMGVLEMPAIPFGMSILLYVFLLANAAISFKVNIPGITPLWSVGVEEQFYAIWPWIVNSTRNYFKTFIKIIVIYMVVKVVCYLAFMKNGIYSLVHHTAIDILAIGGIGAYWVYTNNRILSILFHPVAQIISWGVLLVSYVTGIIRISSIIESEINSVFAFVIILNVAANKKTIISLEHKIFNFLGKISYGIYVYHMLVIFCVGYLIKHMNLNVGNRVLVNAACLLLTIAIAYISYKYFEQPILRRKKKYMVVASSNEKEA